MIGYDLKTGNNQSNPKINEIKVQTIELKIDNDRQQT